jgi:hypothetical protein
MNEDKKSRILSNRMQNSFDTGGVVSEPRIKRPAVRILITIGINRACLADRQAFIKSAIANRRSQLGAGVSRIAIPAGLTPVFKTLPVEPATAA